MPDVNSEADALTFVSLPDCDVVAFVAESRRGFVDGQVAAGGERSAVERQADELHASILPGGSLNPDHHIGYLVVVGERIGHLWVARDDPSSWYVWDIAIKAEHQGRGLGRAAMQLAEGMVRADAAQAIGLSVLASNDTARGLYGSLGYEVTGSQGGPLLRMSKQLSKP
jgi:ribosomal protein S18 acetylase RimI-like enzyme